jgi:hypothetical protein
VLDRSSSRREADVICRPVANLLVWRRRPVTRGAVVLLAVVEVKYQLVEFLVWRRFVRRN